MKISHKYKFVFIATPKTGSNTIRYGLNEHSNDDEIRRMEVMDNPHITASELKSYIQETGWNWDEYFSFAFVRNPWDRLVSNYFFKRRPRTNPTWKEMAFEDYIFSGGKGTLAQNSQLSYVTDTSGNQLVDFIGKFENLQEDFNIICDKIGIPRQELPHKNKTKHKHYTEYYNDETKQIVAEKFAKDIEYFGYEFGE